MTQTARDKILIPIKQLRLAPSTSFPQVSPRACLHHHLKPQVRGRHNLSLMNKCILETGCSGVRQAQRAASSCIRLARRYGGLVVHLESFKFNYAPLYRDALQWQPLAWVRVKCALSCIDTRKLLVNDRWGISRSTKFWAQETDSQIRIAMKE